MSYVYIYIYIYVGREREREREREPSGQNSAIDNLTAKFTKFG